MIHINNVSKSYPLRHGRTKVLENINLTINPGEKIGILGRNGAGKSTLIRLIGGIEFPTEGYIKREMSVSWPLAFTGGFQGRLTGLDNLKFICRVYGTPFEDKIDFVQDFAELGKFFMEPTETYSSGMQARLAFAISMVIDFDCFLVDEVIAVGDNRFQQKCHDELFVKRKDRAMIFVSHYENYIKEYCNRAAVLINGKLHQFDSVDSAVIAHYQQ